MGVALDAAPVGSISMRSRHSTSPDLPILALARPDATDDAILQRIRRHVILGWRDGRADGLGDDSPLVSSGIIDSAGVLQLVDWLEQSFGIRIEDEAVAIDNFDSLRALSRMVQDRLPGELP